MSINPNLSFEHFMKAAVEEANKRTTLSGGMKIGITGLTRPDKDGEIREYVPCKRNDDGAEGLICPETGDFICIRPAEEGEE